MAAEAEFRKLIELSPDDDYAHEALGRALLKQGRRSEANRYLSDHVEPAEIRVIDGIGHFAPVLAPERIAAALASFFASGD